jgi:hypothetical protein
MNETLAQRGAVKGAVSFSGKKTKNHQDHRSPVAS